MYDTKVHDQEARPTLSARNSLISVICGLVDLWSWLSANAASLANQSAASSRSVVDWVEMTSLIGNTLTRWQCFNSGWQLTGTISVLALKPLLVYLRPSATGLGHSIHGLVGLFLTWWIWHHSIAWILNRAILLLPFLYFSRWGNEARLLEMNYSGILGIGAGLIGLTVVNFSGLLGFFSWVTCCSALAYMYVTSSRAPSCDETEVPKL